MSQRPFIPISDDDSLDCERDFDLETMSAMDYLKQVRYERKKIPQVVTVHPLRVSVSTDSVQINEKVVEYHQQDPTKEFGILQKNKFEEMQQRISELRGDPCLSQKIIESPELSAANEKTCISFCKAYEPKLSIILALNQGQLEELLEALSNHFIDIVETPEFYPNLSNFFWITKWIYSTLICLRSPLDPEVHNTLRVIAKTSIQVRNVLKSHSESSSEPFLHYNLIICVIAYNFRQFDLLSL